MFLVLAIILAVAWLFGFLIFHAAGFAMVQSGHMGYRTVQAHG
jgi:hypothetical protein